MKPLESVAEVKYRVGETPMDQFELRTNEI